MSTELKRKAFHLLSLVYLLAYWRLGAPVTLWALAAWIALEGTIEAVRLRRPAFNAWLMRLFGGIHRDKEAGRVSGIFWTALGSWLTLWIFAARPAVVTAAILYLALGDAAAALVGKSLGRVKFNFWGRTKSLEGSLACLAVCLACGRAAGLSWGPASAGALAATLTELSPVPIDDNLWLPLVSAAVLSLVC